MIKYLYSISCLLASLAISAQEFAPIGAMWHYGYDLGFTSSYKTYESVKDTVISGFSLRKLKRKTLIGSFDQADGRFVEQVSLYVTSKEDTAYIYNPVRKKLDKLYIFNAQKGDTLTLDVPYYSDPNFYVLDTTFRVVIDSVAVENFGGKPVKKYKTIALDEILYVSQWYYDFAGDSHSFLPFNGVFPTAGNDGPLRCYSDPNIFMKLEDIDCDDPGMIIIAGLDKVNANNPDIQVFYSPEDKTIRIESPLPEGTYETEILTLEGIKITSFTESLHSLKNLTEGIYLVRIKSGHAFLYSSKFHVR